MTRPCSALTPLRRAGEAQRQHGRAEAVGGVGRVVTAEREDRVEGRPSSAATGPRYAGGELGREVVVPGRDRSVGREHEARRGGERGLVEPEALVAGQSADPLEGGERGVALVEVDDRRLDPERVRAREPAESRGRSSWRILTSGSLGVQAPA